MTSSGVFPGYDGLPLMNAAGTVKTTEQMRSLLRVPIPAIMVGSYAMHERTGNAGTTYYYSENVALNSIGLQSPPLEVWTARVREMSALAHAHEKELWVSVAGLNPREYRELTEAALESGADAVEVNLGCPNIWSNGEQKPLVSYSLEETRTVLGELKQFAGQRIGVKLSPLLDPLLLTAIDGELKASKISFVTAINTLPNCFAFDERGKSALTCEPPLGGLSGPVVRFVGLGQVRQHRALLGDMTIVGVGGVATGTDASEYLDPMIGADVCQVGTAYLERGASVFVDILQEFADVHGASGLQQGIRR